MIEDIFSKFQADDQDESQRASLLAKHIEAIPLFSESDQKERYIDPPRELPKRSYSLEPDMANGWKPKKGCKVSLNNVFSINYDQYVVDEIAKGLYKNKRKYKEMLAYLGPRRNNSYVIHQGKPYDNPYPVDKKLDQLFSARRGLPLTASANDSFLKFQSDFQGGNLDLAMQTGPHQFDLYMRVDTNTRGHTNWFYFQVSNEDFIGSITFKICNFRRDKSLYQRGLKPYILSKLHQDQWHQGGKNIHYQRTKTRYQFLPQQEDEQFYELLNTFFTMSFTYDFELAHDTVQFAYCIPYGYGKLLKVIAGLGNGKIMPSLKSLSGLAVPVLEITDEEVPEYNKKVILVTGRIHPGESNSSYVAEGMMEYLCGGEQTARELRRLYIFYLIPMLNPDGVIAGNYRTSFFGKDLNRTFDQSRKYAFPETFHLLQFVKELKKLHKKRFCIYLDLHGHSVKKNVFMYGPDFNIQHSNYQICRELPRLLGNMTSYFRYYSCIFRISNQKTSTARAVLNRNIDIPFTYTMESSNGFYYDSVMHSEIPFTAKKWKEMGAILAKALGSLKIDQKIKRENLYRSVNEKEEVADERNSDDEISEGKSDSEPEDEDLSEKELKEIQSKIEGKDTTISPEKSESPEKGNLRKANSKDLSKANQKREKAIVFLPPINTLNRAMIFSNRHRKKQSFKQERLRNIETHLQQLIIEKQMKPRLTLSQLIAYAATKDTVKSSSFHLKKQSCQPKFRTK